MVLGDFREAMRWPIGTGFFCYRAIEAIMHSMKATESEDEATVSWPRMRDCLRIERKAIDVVKAHADLPRHGKPSSITDKDRGTVLRLTDQIIERYLAFLVGGKKPLSAATFPMLSP
jgi:hypothetical protein